MDDLISRFVPDLIGRMHGPFAFRFVLQPIMAYRVMRVLVLGVVMDVLYQLIVFKTIHPLQLVVIVLLLAFAPYLALRGPVNRIAQKRTSMKIHTWDAHAPRRHS